FLFILDTITLFLFFFLLIPPPPRSTLFPYTTLFRSLRSSSSTRSRNGRVPAFELLRRPTTRPSSVGTRLANGTAFSATPASGASNSIGGIPGTLLSPRQQLRRRGLLEPLELGDEACRAAEQAAE